MPSIVNRRFRAFAASQLMESLSEASPSRYYVYIGRVTAWPSENNPPTPAETVQATRFASWRDAIAMKRVQASDASYAATRLNWANNTGYFAYTDTSTSLPTARAFVLTDDNSVFKCIANNASGGSSTVKPTGTATTILDTSDGYRWKYMYTISAADALKFLTTNYMPVKTLTANDGSAQWSVQQAAANGSIDSIVVSSGGSAYVMTTNNFSAVGNSTTLTLGTSASGADDAYVKSSLYISSGLGSGQIRRVINYVGATRVVTVNSAFTTTPNTSSKYILGPTLAIGGDSGSTSALRATAYVSRPMNQAAAISRVTMISVGRGYSTANVAVIANAGTGAALTAIISPPGGHGSDPVGELFAHNVMFNVQLSGSESNTFPTNNDFRTIGLVVDSRLRGGPVANASAIDLCGRIAVTALSGDLTADEVITGSPSGAKARFVRFSNTNAAMTAGIVRVVNVTTTGTGGYFAASDTITGATSGKTATVASYTRPAVREFTGDIVYQQTRAPVSRASDQVEDIKFLITL